MEDNRLKNGSEGFESVLNVVYLNYSPLSQ
jgi:hypothetical protein